MSQSSSNKVVVLDRDGTIVIDREYLSDAAQLEFKPLAAQGLRALYERGYRLVVVTNQSGVGRGMYTLDNLHEIHQKLAAMMDAAGAPPAGIYYCPHTPEDACLCRKPNTGLIVQAVSELNFDPTAAFMIGDKLTDIEFGRRFGATTMLVSSARHATGATATPDFVVENLWEAAQIICDLERCYQL